MRAQPADAALLLADAALLHALASSRAHSPARTLTRARARTLRRLRITNETEYRAWNPRHNGVKRQSDGVREGHFGAINLLGPRSTAQLPTYKFWNDQFSIVQLRYSFMTEISQGAYRADSSGVYGLRPLNVGRMYMTFWDMDTGMPTFGASQVQKEAMQMGPQVRVDSPARTLSMRIWPARSPVIKQRVTKPPTAARPALSHLRARRRVWSAAWAEAPTAVCTARSFTSTTGPPSSAIMARASTPRS